MLFDGALQQLDRRCATLQQRSAVLRDAAARDGRALQAPLAVGDQLLAGWRWLMANPVWIGVGVAGLVVWRPRRAWRLGARAWRGWRLWRRAQRWRVAVGLLLRRR